MRLHTQFYWEHYLSSMEKIIHMTLEVMGCVDFIGYYYIEHCVPAGPCLIEEATLMCGP